jgi:hypothetical protein
MTGLHFNVKGREFTASSKFSSKFGPTVVTLTAIDKWSPKGWMCLVALAFEPCRYGAFDGKVEYSMEAGESVRISFPAGSVVELM